MPNELYPNCRTFIELSCRIKLCQLNSLSDKSLTMLLILLKELLIEFETLPNIYYEEKELIMSLNFTCNQIDTCPNDCMSIGKRRVRTTFAASVRYLGEKVSQVHRWTMLLVVSLVGKMYLEKSITEATKIIHVVKSGNLFVAQ